MNTYFEQYLGKTAFSSSSFKLGLADVTVFSDLNLALTNAFYNSMHTKISIFLQARLFFSMLSSLNITELCFFIHFQRIDVKSNRCFSDLSLISIILWEYLENNIKTFWYSSSENKWIILRVVGRFFFFFFFFLRLFKVFPPIRFIYSHKNIRENKLI